VTDRPSTLGLMIRPAARIIRELPPRRESYRVAVFFRAAPLAAPAVVRSTAGCGRDESKQLTWSSGLSQTVRFSTALTRCSAGFKNKKAVKSDPGGRTQVLWTQATPFGVGIILNGFHLLRLPHLCRTECTTTFQPVSSTLLKNICLR
jgi:hypothetical protein